MHCVLKKGKSKRGGRGGEEKAPGRGGKFPFQVDFTGQKGYNLSKKKINANRR